MKIDFTPKARMLAAYRGEWCDRRPVAPEFWFYYPAKLLGVSMIEFEREVPFWQALQNAFRTFGCEGWGATGPSIVRQGVEAASSLTKAGDGIWDETTEIVFRGKRFTSRKSFSLGEPSWQTKRIASDPRDFADAVEMVLGAPFEVDSSYAVSAHAAVGEDYLLEMSVGLPFTDFVADLMGFENAVLWFADTPEEQIAALHARYLAYQLEITGRLLDTTPFESYFVGCGYSCNSLFGPALWRRWDAPYIREIARLVHGRGRLLHVHFHGRSIDCRGDFARLGIDCVCPFERAPGGDVTTPAELRMVREALDGRVTFNGNVHTVETLIRGTPELVRAEVRQINEAFAGSPRLIIGTGDQVGGETPEDNLFAMIDEVKGCTMN